MEAAMKRLGPEAERLLRAGNHFDPPRDARARVRRAVAVRVAGAAAIVTAATAEKAAASTPALTKFLLGLAMTGAVVGGGVGVARYTGAGPKPPVVEQASVSRGILHAVAAPRVAPAPSGAMSVATPLDPVAATPIASAIPARQDGGFVGRRAVSSVSDKRAEVAPVERESPIVPPPSLAAEAATLRKAHVARMSGDPAGALSWLEVYARAWPLGAMRDEASVERALALCALGRVDEARAVARGFLAAAPTSPLAARLRSSCSGAIP
jgi:hypothetical protein